MTERREFDMNMYKRRDIDNKDPVSNIKEEVVHKKRRVENKRSAIQNLIHADIYNFNSLINVFSTFFLFVTISTSAYVGYMLSSSSSWWAIGTVMSGMGVLGFLESFLLFYSLSALYYKKFTLFMVTMAGYSVLGLLGFFTNTFTFNNIISEGIANSQLKADRLQFASASVQEQKYKMDKMLSDKDNSIQVLMTKINTRIANNNMQITSSNTNNSYSMSGGSNQPRWKTYCMPGMNNEFTSDVNCANLQLELSNKLAKIENYYVKISDRNNLILKRLQLAEYNVKSEHANEFENSGSTIVKGLIGSKGETGSDILVKLASGSIIVAIWGIILLKIFKDGQAYTFNDTGRQQNMIDMWITAKLDNMALSIQSNKEVANRKLMKQKMESVALQRDLALVEAHLVSVTTTGNRILNDEEVSDNQTSNLDDEKLINSILDSSNTVNEHKKVGTSTEQPNRLREMLDRRKKNS